jgi:TPR repeat protein
MTRIKNVDLCMHRKFLAALAAVLIPAACTPAPPQQPLSRQASPATGQALTYSKYLSQAIAGDAEAQYLVGYMLFLGEGQVRDPEAAHNWFHQAASQDHLQAQKDLALLAGGGLSQGADVRKLEDSPGRRLYAAFCAGCHGLHGIAAYQESPSFALGERMEKPDEELLASIRLGKGSMPDWANKFSEDELRSVLVYLRAFQARYRGGLAASIQDRPDRVFLFGAMEDQESNPEENY